MSPLPSTEIVSGSLSEFRALASLFGRSSGTPAVSSGAATMKMIRRTSMTSMNGVMLMSAMGALRPLRRRLPPPDDAPWSAPAMSRPSGRQPLVDLPRQDGRELVGEALEPRLLLRHLGVELVVGDDGRDRRDESHGGCEQRLRNAGRDRRERGVFRCGDRLEGGHDAPDRAEQADERP